MNSARVCKYIATLGPIGYVSAPGTVATLVTLPLVFWLKTYIVSDYLYILFVGLLFGLSLLVIHQALKPYKRHEDPSEIVLDEVVGCLTTFWGIKFCAPAVVIGFILFRLLDILKLGPIKKSERIVEPWGIMLDDALAALISNGILRLFF